MLPHASTPERPIESQQEDKLERGQFVRRLTSALIDRDSGKARGVVVGLIGPWGSGKSSILNLLRENLKATHPDAIIVSFDPWLVSGRNDLISEFLNELLSTIRSDPKKAKQLKKLVGTFATYAEKLAPALDLLHPGAGVVTASGVRIWNTASSNDISLSGLRKKLLHQLTETQVPIIVLIDELDRIEDEEIRTVAQLVRSIADFPSLSYVLAYDYDRVVQALGGGAAGKDCTERGQLYLEKIVQLQIPLPVTFADELINLLRAELDPLRAELTLTENVLTTERYNKLLKMLVFYLIETPRDVKRLVGAFHIYGGMLGQEVDWVDLLGYCALLIKRPQTADTIRNHPDHFCEELISPLDLSRRIEDRKLSLEQVYAKILPSGENNEGTQQLVGFLFPRLAEARDDSGENRDTLRYRRPLLTTLRLGLIPNTFARREITELFGKSPDEIEPYFRQAYDNGSLEDVLERLNDLYSELPDVNHVNFWQGVASFLRKPDCLWMTTFQPMSDVIQSFAEVLLTAVVRNQLFKPVAEKIFTNLRNLDEDVLTAVWLRKHILMHALFGFEKRTDAAAFLTLRQTETIARDMSSELRKKHLDGRLVPCRWDLMPIFTMLDTGVWDEACQQKLNLVLADDTALDGITLMLFGGGFFTDPVTINKICSQELYMKRVRERLGNGSVTAADESVRNALKKVERTHL